MFPRFLGPAIALAALTGGCGRSSDVVGVIAVRPPGTQAAVIGISEGDSIVSVNAVRLAPDTPFELTAVERYLGRYEVVTTLIFYDLPLDSLDLEEGALAPAALGAPSRSLPPNARLIQTATVAGASVSDWAVHVEVPAPLSDFRLATSDPSACYRRGGCIDESLGENACRDPCPEPSAIAPVTPPAPPNLLPCPTGWLEATVAGVTVCEPWSGARPSCGPFELTLPNQAGCSRVGTACPAGPFPDNIPAGPVLYIDDDAAPGGTGTQQSPFATIQDAVNVAQPGTVLALAKGTYAEWARLPPDGHLLGACPAETLVEYSATASSPTLELTGNAAKISNLSVGGLGTAIQAVGAATRLTVEDVVVRSGTSGLRADSSAIIEASGVLVRNTGLYGVWSRRNSRITFSAGTVRDVVNLGTVAYLGGELEVFDSAIFDVSEHPEHGNGRGVLSANDATRVNVERSVVADTLDAGIYAGDNGQITLDHVVVRNTRPKSENTKGYGLNARDGARITGQRVFLLSNSDAGVWMFKSSAVLEDVVIHDTRSVVLGNGLAFGYGVMLNQDANLTLERALISDSVQYGIAEPARSAENAEADTRLINAFDLRVVGTKPRTGPPTHGIAINIEQGGAFVGERIQVDENPGRAFRATGLSTEVSLKDFAASRMGIGDCFDCAGLCIRKGASATVERAQLSGIFGHAIEVDERATFGGQDISSAAKLTASDVVVTDTSQMGSCTAQDPLSADGKGEAVVTREGGQLDLSQFLIQRTTGSAVLVQGYRDPTTELHLRDGTVEDARTGVLIQIPGFSSAGIANLVVFKNADPPIQFE